MVRTGTTPLVALGTLALAASEIRVKMSDLPLAVQKTVKEQTRGARIRGFSKEVENGKTYYEAETMVNGKSRDILMDSTGTVVEVEEQTDLNSIPAAARRALDGRIGTGKVLRVESVTKGSQVSYEAHILRHGKRSEVTVAPDGTIQE
ncbi:MAG TPA: hypothetical protein VMI94_21840 [Bryobacteraceae bacterium]|nr:hypothetical protein [Bryobacteraceae bacterium]